ncbi:MAG TPA: histidine kinase N-terminal 7TM domain-containing protein, partial [Blastocatellia bacterium]|nr:histidine kinase N-terminal 7TM domain-containing protein [Blastocatellia bacterium]
MMNSVYAIVLPIVVLAMIVIATSMWRHRDAPGAKQYAGIIILAIVWMGGDWLSRVGPNWEWQLFGEKVKYLGVAAIPALLWIATTAYRGQSISHRNVFLLFLIPAFTLVMIWTNPAHTLFWTLLEPSGNSTPKAHYGWYFWLVHTPYSYSMT